MILRFQLSRQEALAIGDAIISHTGSIIADIEEPISGKNEFENGRVTKRPRAGCTAEWLRPCHLGIQSRYNTYREKTNSGLASY